MALTAPTPAPTSTESAESSVSAEDFAFMQRLVADDAAIVLAPGKEYLVATRLSAVARDNAFAGVAELIRQLRIDPRGTLRAVVVDAMTTNETSFFRDARPFEVIADELLPHAVAHRREQGQHQLDIWCAAASSGQEPYSLAMLLVDKFPEIVRDWQIRIIGTDLSPTMIRRCREARFSQLEINRGLPASRLVHHFERKGLDWVASDQLRSLCHFEEANLAGPWPVLPRFDLVLCRNVLIYFEVATKRDILRRTRSALQPWGTLLLGASETTLGLDDDWSRSTSGTVSYYRPNGHSPQVPAR
jgi:chemotaxis protein methyltransferase CheR